ncbi:MAG: DUF3549 family protein [Pontibacterium sp.]
MSHIPSLVDFLRESGTQIRIFDMGRRVSKMSAETFSKVEQAHIPYPSPFMHHAWVALLMWNPKLKDQNVVWFLKLPLDEQGYLVQAARDDFVNRLLQNINNVLSGDADSKKQDALQDNPFSFKPDQEKMAIFHAHATLAIGQPASQYYEYSQQYFAGQLGFDQWQALGYQGVADLVVRHESGRNSEILAAAIAKLPAEPYEVLCTCLENIEPDHKLFSALDRRMRLSLQDEATHANHIAAQIRAISNGRDETAKRDLLQLVLESAHGQDAEVLAAIATRSCNSLKYPDLLKSYLECLATGRSGQIGFSRMLADLMFMPDLRALILQAFRSPDRSDALTAAIGKMFGDNLG